MKKRQYFAALMLLPIALSGCGEKDTQTDTNEPVRVKTMQISASTISETGHYSGTVEEKSGTALSFSSAGTIRSIRVSLGDRVRKGQLIATLDDTSARSSHEAAKATLAQAEDAWRRMKELHDKGSLPEIKWVEVESKLQQARSMEAVARKMLDDCQLKAPFAGLIADKTGEVGQNVMPGMPVAQLVSDSERQVKIDVPEAEIGKVFTGQDAQISVPALNGRRYEAMVTDRGVVANPLTRSYTVKLRLYSIDDKLMPGMVANVSLLAKDTTKNIVLPAHVVQLDEYNRFFVWTDNGGKAEKRMVQCREFTADGVVIANGLTEGDRIIVEGQQKVCNGTPVTSL